MADDGNRSVRQAVLGADRALRVIDGGARKTPPPSGDDGDHSPVTPLGQRDGVFHLLDVRGQHRALTARQLGARHDLVSLFGGNDAWLRETFPRKKAFKQTDEGGDEVTVWRTVDFMLNDAALSLQRSCFDAGLFGEHIMLRQPGIWRDADGMPVVHCGDKVLLGRDWSDAGARTGDQIWAAAPATPRPGIPCSTAEARYLQDHLTALWRWREAGAPIAVLGLIANSYFGAALDWRPSGYFTGETGSGKTALQNVVRAALPLHHYDNDTTKAGIEQAVHGRAMPILIDEAADRANRGAGRDLADLMLSAAGGEGTKGSRGTNDGKGRKIELAGLIMMFSINPPDLEPQHLGRLTLIDLDKPEDGADFRVQHRELARYARNAGPALWARALGAWDRYNTSLERFREGLRAQGCAPREMDQAGALLAGWWILTEEGLPDERGVKIGISALHGGVLTDAGLIRVASDVEADSRSRRMLQHLLASMINLHRSSEREPVGKLVEIGFEDVDEFRSPTDARELLTHYGIRVVLPCNRIGQPKPMDGCPCPRCHDKRGRVPRFSDDGGLWFGRRNPELRKLFSGTPFEGDRWTYEMARLPSAHKSQRNVRIGSSYSGAAIWIARSDLLEKEADTPV